MPLPFDATLKDLAESFPRDWLKLAGVEPQGEISVIDADVSTISAAADKVIRIDEGQQPWLLHLEFQTSYDAALPERIHFYSTLLSRRHGLPVMSVAVLLTPSSDGPAMNGAFGREQSTVGRYLDFRFQEIRLWEIPFDTIIDDGHGVWPLALLASDADDERLKQIVDQSTTRILREMPRQQAATLLSAEYILAGLRFPKEVIDPLFENLVSVMQESVTFQALWEKARTEGLQAGIQEGFQEGRQDGIRAAICEVGAERLGEPDPEVRSALNQIKDLSRLKALLHRVNHVSNWRELLNEPEAE